MLALLSAPRGRVSAARVAARARAHAHPEAQRATIRLPDPPPVTSEGPRRASATREAGEE